MASPSTAAEPPHRDSGARVETELSMAERGATAIRIGLGVVWTLNLLFILDPANQFFTGFSATSQSFATTSLGGPTLAEYVAAHGDVFSVLIAGVTSYLAVAFLIGWTTRVACLIGIGFNTVLLITQFGSIVVIPGGTDVGPMPLYLVMYGGILLGGHPTPLSVDNWWQRRRELRATPMQTQPGGSTRNVRLRWPRRRPSFASRDSAAGVDPAKAKA